MQFTVHFVHLSDFACSKPEIFSVEADFFSPRIRFVQMVYVPLPCSYKKSV